MTINVPNTSSVAANNKFSLRELDLNINVRLTNNKKEKY